MRYIPADPSLRWPGTSPMDPATTPMSTARIGPPMTNSTDLGDFESDTVHHLRDDLALALRAAAHHGLAEGVCNHFSVELPDRSGRFLLNPRGLLWSEVGGGDIVMVDGEGRRLAGRPDVE